MKSEQNINVNIKLNLILFILILLIIGFLTGWFVAYEYATENIWKACDLIISQTT